MRPPGGQLSMASRVMWATALSAAAGGVLAAAIAILTIDTLVEGYNDQQLRSSTGVLAGEIDEMRAEQEHDSLDEVLEDENGEIVTSGVRLAVYEDGEVIAGDPWAPVSRPGECTTVGKLGQRIRTCGRSYDRWTLVAAQRSDMHVLRSRFVLAGLAALAVATLLGAFWGRRLSRWAVTPLEGLSRRLRESEPNQVLAEPRGDRSSCAEVAQIERALADLMQRVRTLLDHAQRFAADAAHELRTPLTALCAELELLREDSTGPTRARVDAALHRSRQLANLVDRLLTLASPADRLHAGNEPLALDELAADVIADLPDASRRRIELCAESEGLISGDPTLLRSLVANAVDNALKFSDPEPVTIRVREIGATVRLEVCDRGPGIPSEVAARMFEPFYRHRPDATPGHGLGLALIAHIAEAHRARARFEDRRSGAALVVDFPHWRAS